MTTKRFLSIFGFPDFGPALLRKDVGAVPRYLASVCGWESALAFFESDPDLPRRLRASGYGDAVALISLGSRRGRIANAASIAAFLLRRGREFDVLNFYHDGVAMFLYGLLFKAVRPGGVVYLKLDMSHLEVQRLQETSKRLFPRLARRAKHLLSRASVDLYTTETTHVYDRLAGDFYFRGRLHYVPNGFTPDRDEDPGEWMDRKENVILTVGRLGDTPKFNELLVDAVEGLDPGLLSGWKVRFVGPVVSASFRAYVDAALERAPHLRDVVEFTGNIEDREQLYDIYRRAKVFCLTSRWESFGFVVLEAMYFADYVIASDLPAPRDLTRGGAIGALFPPGDVARLRALLSDAIGGRVDLAALGIASHRAVKERFDWRVIVRGLDALLRDAAAGNRAGGAASP